jgi:hypothetical protein
MLAFVRQNFLDLSSSLLSKGRVQLPPMSVLPFACPSPVQPEITTKKDDISVNAACATQGSNREDN